MSTLRCKPGDLAVVIGGSRENLGKCVTVLKYLPYGTEIELPGGRNATVASTTAWLVEFADGDTGGFEDYNLLPIRPEPDPEEQLHQVEVPTS